MSWKSDHDFLNFFQHSDFLANFCASFALQPIQIKKTTIDTTYKLKTLKTKIWAKSFAKEVAWKTSTKK